MFSQWSTRYGEWSAHKASNNVLLARRGKFTREVSDEGRHSRGEDHYSRGRAMNDSTGRIQNFIKTHQFSWF